MTSIARLYREAQTSMATLFESLDEDELAIPVPCTPLWTVRDVLSHVAGVTDDIANGRTEGAASDPWTAAQVTRWRDTEPMRLIMQWNGQIDGIADLLEHVGEMRPPIDCWTHEQDVRQALGHDAQVAGEIVTMAIARFGAVPVGPPVAIAFVDGTTASIPGDGDPLSLGGISPYEFVRSRLGRRSREQVAGYDWSRPPSDELLTNWFAFGPSEAPIIESTAD
jgi:uncharacterized protein (TIGR03083 family)